MRREGVRGIEPKESRPILLAFLVVTSLTMYSQRCTMFTWSGKRGRDIQASGLARHAVWRNARSASIVHYQRSWCMIWRPAWTKGRRHRVWPEIPGLYAGLRLPTGEDIEEDAARFFGAVSVRDPMSDFVLDTHACVFALVAPNKLGAAAEGACVKSKPGGRRPGSPRQ